MESLLYNHDKIYDSMATVISLESVKRRLKNSVKKQILAEAKKVMRGEAERAVVCVSGDKEMLESIVRSLRNSARNNGATFIDARKDKTDLLLDEKKYIYVYSTSVLDQGDDYWLSQHHPGFVLVLEDGREFQGMCIRFNIKEEPSDEEKMEYIVEEANRVANDVVERKVMCVSGDRQKIKELIRRLKISARRNGIPVLTKPTRHKAFYILSNDKIPEKGFVLLINQTTEECEKIKL